jgi:hypothetical protein
VCRKTFDQALHHAANPPRSDELCDRVLLAKLHAYENLERLQDMLHNFETTHNINSRWTLETEQWQHAANYLAIRDYQKALDKLEGLVVQRLFELAKMGLSGTGKYGFSSYAVRSQYFLSGYKMRTHINKSLKTRCKAIQTALCKFNAAAKATNRPQLDWNQVSTYGSLTEFELLRECRDDIHSEPWADSRN